MTTIECVIEDEAWSAAGDLETLAAEAVTAAEAELSLPGGKGVCILFAGDEAIADLNAAHRGKTGPTNVLSFPAHDSAEGWLGDIALASGVCLKEADERGIAPADHVRHLLIHGFLHLHGYDHQADSEAEEMEAIERRALARLGVADPYAVGGRMNE